MVCGFRAHKTCRFFLQTAVYNSTTHHAAIARNFCTINEGKTFTELRLKKRFEPKEHEADELNKRFPNPEQIIKEFYSPFTGVPSESHIYPEQETLKSKYFNLYTSQLKLQWPLRTEAVGIHTDKDTAVQRSYLRACDYLHKMGLLQTKNSVPEVLNPSKLTGILEHVAGLQTPELHLSSNFRIINTLEMRQDEEVLWRCTLQVLWPVEFTVSSESQCLDMAYYQTCARAAIKLKALGCLNEDNTFKQGILLSLNKYSYLLEKLVPRTLINPDYELYVDASKQGMGGYLLSNSGDDDIRWMSDSWEQDQKGFKYSSTDVNMKEFYALLTAFHTWKHKFVDKKVLCYSDNRNAVNLVNHGIYSINRRNSNINIYKDLYMKLMNVCERYRITLVSAYVPRENNHAADLLSRCDVDKFKELVPTANKHPKKTKKLWFIKNLTVGKSKHFSKMNDPPKDKRPDGETK